MFDNKVEGWLPSIFFSVLDVSIFDPVKTKSCQPFSNSREEAPFRQRCRNSLMLVPESDTYLILGTYLLHFWSFAAPLA